MPGLVGLNDMRANDYANVIIQVRHFLIHLLPLLHLPLLLVCDQRKHATGVDI